MSVSLSLKSEASERAVQVGGWVTRSVAHLEYEIQLCVSALLGRPLLAASASAMIMFVLKRDSGQEIGQEEQECEVHWAAMWLISLLLFSLNMYSRLLLPHQRICVVGAG